MRAGVLSGAAAADCCGGMAHVCGCSCQVQQQCASVPHVPPTAAAAALLLLCCFPSDCAEQRAPADKVQSIQTEPSWPACPPPSTGTSGLQTRTQWTRAALLSADCCIVLGALGSTHHAAGCSPVLPTPVQHCCAATAAWQPNQLLTWPCRMLAAAHRQLRTAGPRRLSGCGCCCCRGAAKGCNASSRAAAASEDC